MAIMLTVTLLSAFAALAYAIYKGDQCDVLTMENARLQNSARHWKAAYENVATENRAITYLGRSSGEDS